MDQSNLLLEKKYQLTPQNTYPQDKCKYITLIPNSYSCQKQAKYVCPKCSIPYCSLSCYKVFIKFRFIFQQHNEKCLEQFQKEHEKSELSGKKASFDEIKQTKEFLRKMYDEMGEESIVEEEDQIKRIEELVEMMESEELDLNKLTIREQEEFYEFAKSHEVESSWKPWWEVEEGKFSLYVLDESTQVKQFGRNKLQERIRTIPKFDKICKSVNEDIRNHLMNIIFSIALTSRVFNGELNENCQEIFEFLCSVCRCLKQKKEVFGNLMNSYNTFLRDAVEHDKELSGGYRDIILEDGIKISQDKFYVVESLFQGFDIVHRYEYYLDKMDVEEEEDVRKRKEIKKELSLKKNKLIFFISMVLWWKQQELEGMHKDVQDILIDL